MRFAWVSVVFGLFLVTIICIVFVVFDDFVATLFTRDEATVNIIKMTLPVLSFYIWFDSIHGV